MTQFKSLFMDTSLSRVRRNHAMEHATLQVLAHYNPRRSMAGYSDLHGFWILGPVSTDELQQAVDEALQRLKAGEAALAIHPNCGTNFVVSGLAAGTAAWLALLFTGNSLRKRAENWPVAVMMATLALIFAQPLGPMLQNGITTQPNVGALEVVGINIRQWNGRLVHRVLTRG
jgi:hypothetical protein